MGKYFSFIAGLIIPACLGYGLIKQTSISGDVVIFIIVALVVFVVFWIKHHQAQIAGTVGFAAAVCLLASLYFFQQGGEGVRTGIGLLVGALVLAAIAGQAMQDKQEPGPGKTMDQPTQQTLPGERSCDACNGAGTIQEWTLKMCPSCGGASLLRDGTKCPHCPNGMIGEWSHVRCTKCGGSGTISS